jgi:hypothetical protein
MLRYHGAVERLRVVACVLLLSLAAGPMVLDRCLISCHDQPAAAAAPPCHQQPAVSDAPSIRGVGACDHDHESLVADSSNDSKVGPTAPVAAASRPVSPVTDASDRTSSRLVSASASSSPPSRSPVRVPLRV